MQTTLHIGTAKTGTSSLQQFFKQNQAALAKQGIAYTTDLGKGNNQEFAMYGLLPGEIEKNAYCHRNNILTAEDKHVFDNTVLEKLNNIVKHASGAGSRLLFSSEHFSSALRQQQNLYRIKQLCDQVNINVTKVVLYIREQTDFIFSEFGTSLIMGLSAMARPQIPNVPGVSRFNHAHTLQLWRKTFPEAEIVVRIFEKSQLVNQNIIADFAAIEHIDLSKTENNQRRNNTALSAEALSFWAQYNKIIAAMPRQKALAFSNREVRKILVNQCREHLAGSPIQATLEERKKIQEVYAQSNEEVRKQYFPDKKRLFEI